MKQIIGMIGIIFWIVGCASTSRFSKTVFSPQNFLENQAKREDELQNIQGKLRVRYLVKDKALSGQGRLMVENGKSRFELSDPMGRVRFWMVSDESETFAVYEDEKTAYLSTDSGKSYHLKWFGFDLTTKELQQLWAGILPRKWRDQKETVWDSLNEKFAEAKTHLGKDAIRFQVNKETGLVSQIDWEGPSKKIKFIVSDFDACCSSSKGEKLLGHNVRVFLTTEPDQVELEWEELNIPNEKLNPLIFSKKLPRGTKVVRLEK